MYFQKWGGECSSLATGHLRIQKAQGDPGIGEATVQGACEGMKAVRAVVAARLQCFGCQATQFEFCPKMLKVVLLTLFLVTKAFKNLLKMTSPFSTKFYMQNGNSLIL